MRRWIVAAAALAAVAGLLTWRITRPEHGATRPVPAPTYPGTPDAALREPAEPVAVSATPYPPGQGVQVRLVTDHGLYAVDTARGTTVNLTREFTDPVGAALALPHGWAALVGPDDPKQSRRLVVEVGGRRTVTTVTGRDLRPGTGDDFWTGDHGGVVQHRDATGARVGAPIRLPASSYLVRGTVAGLLVEFIGDGGYTLFLYDPATGRRIRTVARNRGGTTTSATSRYVLWQGHGTDVRLTDLVTGAERVVPMPPGQPPGSIDGGSVAPDGTVAYTSQDYVNGGNVVYVAGPADTSPRLVMRVPIFQFYPVWLGQDRLAVVLATQTQSILYGFEGGELSFAGAYHIVVQNTVLPG